MDLSPRRRSIWDIPDDADAPAPTVPDITGRQVPLHKLWANPFNPRIVHDDAEIDAMAESIKSEGLLQDLMIADVGPFLTYWTDRLRAAPRQRALLTESLTKARPDDYVILIGHNRHAACARAGLDHAPCRLRNDKINRARVLALPENLRRIKLNPIEEALGFQGAVEDGLTQAEIASQVGCRQPHISRRLKLLHLVDDLRDAVMTGDLRTADAELIAGTLPDGDHRQAHVLDRMRTHGMSAPAALAHLEKARAFHDPTEDQPGDPTPSRPTAGAPADTLPEAALQPDGPRPDAPQPNAEPTQPTTGPSMPPPPTADGSLTRTEACQHLLQATTAPNPREALRLLTPAVLLAGPAEHRLARTWLQPAPTTRSTHRQPFADLLDHPKAANQAALAIALAALEHRTQHTPRPWTPADRTYIEHLTRHAGYHPTPWEQDRLHTKAPTADIPTE
ncbi:ParB/RepB/Spo0J family partition protein [Kitasatospora paracochleata]|uniref:ParB/RepB/Spo0J family partition protein n=2 Tax=Kitasatospora paracochleata TaxID=58354 RepID=A0ABT1J9K5_9ACTN|nr:hypothetical protein [Kitasatospora paracochleata]MCP2314136.1 ParB/RepB/Spo0J family partition protein [Kitasatospora paracochleata]